MATMASPAKGCSVPQLGLATFCTSCVHSCTRLLRRACWDTGVPSTTNSIGNGISGHASLCRPQVAVSECRHLILWHGIGHMPCNRCNESIVGTDNGRGGESRLGCPKCPVLPEYTDQSPYQCSKPQQGELATPRPQNLPKFGRCRPSRHSRSCGSPVWRTVAAGLWIPSCAGTTGRTRSLGLLSGHRKKLATVT